MTSIHSAPADTFMAPHKNVYQHDLCLWLRWSVYCRVISLIARFMGSTWGPSGTDRTQLGPILAPWTLLYGMFYNFTTFPRIWPFTSSTCSRHRLLYMLPSAVITRSSITKYCIHHCNYWSRISKAEPTKDSPCMALTGQLWGVFG